MIFGSIVVGREGVGPAATGVPARRASAALAELGELVAVGVEDPAVGTVGFLAGADPAAADPAVQGDGWHGELGGQLVQPPLVGAGRLAWRRGDPRAGDGGRAAQVAQELLDRADPDAVMALGGAEALGVQTVGDGLGAVALLGELRVAAELLQAGNRPDGVGVGGVPAGPADLHGHAFAGAHHGDGDLVHQRADDLLAVGVGGGRRGP